VETFIISDESGRLREFEVLTGRLVIGRSKRCDIRIKDGSISSMHAAIEKATDGYYVVDLDSTNGIRVDGQRVKREKVSPGRIVQLGRLVLQMKPVAEAAASAKPGAVSPEDSAPRETQPPAAEQKADVAPLPPAPPEELGRSLARQVALYRWVAVISFLLILCGVASFLYYYFHLRHELAARRAANRQHAAAKRTELPPEAAGAAEILPPERASVPPADENPAVEDVPADAQPAEAPDDSTPTAVEPAVVPPAEPAGTVESPAAAQAPEPTAAPHAWLAIPLNSEQVVRTRKGRTYQGTLVGATASSIELMFGDGSVSVTRTIPIEQVESIGSVPVSPNLEELFQQKAAGVNRASAADLFELAMWCRQYGLHERKDEVLNMVVALTPEHKAARKELRQALYEGKWQPIADLEKRGLHQYKDEWFSEEQLRAKGLHEYEGEWLSESEMMKRKGLVRYGDKWVTEEEKKMLGNGQVNYLGVWVPANVLLELMKDSYYETLLRKLRAMNEGDIRKQANTLLGHHFRSVSDKLGTRLTEAQRAAELVRILAVVAKAKALSDSDFEVSARVLAQELPFADPVESYGYRRFANFTTTFVCDELQRETASHNLAAALGLDSHQVMHMWLLTQDAQNLTSQYKYRLEKANKTAEEAFQKLRDALLNGVNVGFDTPNELERQAAGAEQKLKQLRDEIWRASVAIEEKALHVLTSDQVAMADAYNPSLLPLSPKDLKIVLANKRQKAKEDAAGRKEPPPKKPDRPGELGNIGNYLLNSAAASYMEARLKAERVNIDLLSSTRSCGREKCDLNRLHVLNVK
jgi:hypothetical protein